MPGTRARTAAACGVRLAAIIAASSLSVGAAGAVVPALRLDVLLTVSPQLSDIARRTLVGEAERIWHREQIDLEWAVPRGGPQRPDAPLRVLVIARAGAVGIEESRWPVAELVPHEGQRALAIASIDGARRVVDEAARFRMLDLPVTEDYRLGLVLGRAVAHEIGHFLLATATHADSGLMRATVGAHEFAAVGPDTFRLDEGASRWIRQRLASEAPAVRALRAAGFSYSR